MEKRWISLVLLFLLFAGCTRASEGTASQSAAQEQASDGWISRQEQSEMEEGEAFEEEEPSIFAEPEPESSIGEAGGQGSAAAGEGVSGASPGTVARQEPAASGEEAALPSPEGWDGEAHLSLVERQVIDLINAERRALGLGWLQIDPNLTRAARIRSGELYQNRYFAHTRPGGEQWQTVLEREVPMDYASAGENLAEVEHNMPDYDPAQDASYWYTTWENSPSHHENMIRPEFTHVGVGIYYRVEVGMVHAYATTILASYR